MTESNVIDIQRPCAIAGCKEKASPQNDYGAPLIRMNFCELHREEWIAFEISRQNTIKSATRNLLDTFAAHALSGLLASRDNLDILDTKNLANSAYCIADAMMKERE